MNLNNVAVGELNIKPPHLDLNQVKKFCQDTEQEYLASADSLTNKIYFDRNTRGYPWHRRVLESAGQKLFSTEIFDEVFLLINDLPVVKHTRRVVMIYQDIQPPYDFVYHFDGDNPFGFRICYGLETDFPFLSIQKLKNPFIEHARKFNKITEDMLEGREILFTPKNSDCVLLLNGTSHPHAVPVRTTNSQRAVFIVLGTIDDIAFNPEFNQVFEKSL